MIMMGNLELMFQSVVGQGKTGVIWPKMIQSSREDVREIWHILILTQLILVLSLILFSFEEGGFSLSLFIFRRDIFLFFSFFSNFFRNLFPLIPFPLPHPPPLLLSLTSQNPFCFSYPNAQNLHPTFHYCLTFVFLYGIVVLVLELFREDNHEKYYATHET